MSTRLFTPLLALAAAATPALAQTFLTPTVWTRPTATGGTTTFQGWETFASTAGPNAPQTVPAPAFGGSSGTWSPVNAGGPANAFDTNAANSFITGGGNIYSPTGIVAPRVTLPNNIDGVAGNNPLGWTTLILQLRTQGNEIAPASVLLNGTIAPVSRTELYRQVLGGFGGNLVDNWYQFQVAGNADSYQIDFSAAASSLSLDRIAIDTAWNPAAVTQGQAFLEPTPVPEPASLFLLGSAAALLARRIQSRVTGRQPKGEPECVA